MREAQHHRGAALRPKLLQYDPEPRDPLRCIKVSIELRQRLETLVRGGLVDVDAARLSTVEHGVLLHKIVRYRVEVVDGIANGLPVIEPQHPDVDLLRQIRCIGLGTDSPQEKCLQRASVVSEQPLDQRWFRLSHSHRPCNFLSSCI